MSMQDVTQSQSAHQWHPPWVYEFDDHVLTPPARQLRLSSIHPSRKRTDHAREAELNRDRQDRWRERQIDSKSCGGTVEWGGDVLTMLIEMGQIQDDETGDPKVVARAISDMLEEAAQAWRRSTKTLTFL
jgi:hypothetical protein